MTDNEGHVPGDDEKHADAADAAVWAMVNKKVSQLGETTYPTSMCRGKKPISEPKRSAPKRKKVSPVLRSQRCLRVE